MDDVEKKDYRYFRDRVVRGLAGAEEVERFVGRLEEELDTFETLERAQTQRWDSENGVASPEPRPFWVCACGGLRVDLASPFVAHCNNCGAQKIVEEAVSGPPAGRCICGDGWGLNLSCPLHKPKDRPADDVPDDEPSSFIDATRCVRSALLDFDYVKKPLEVAQVVVKALWDAGFDVTSVGSAVRDDGPTDRQLDELDTGEMDSWHNG